MALGINNVNSALNANNSLAKAKKNQSSAMEKLSSGLRINKGSDDPAGLLISELLRSQIGGYQRALRNTQETNNVMSIAEGGLGSVSAMLTKMRGLAVHALNSGVTSGVQVQADQMELNSALSTISRVVSTTSYSGNNLLDGSRDFLVPDQRSERYAKRIRHQHSQRFRFGAFRYRDQLCRRGYRPAGGNGVS